MKDWQNSIGRVKAIALAESHWWESCDARQIATFQLYTAELCCPFGVFHEAIETALGRPVFTHEFGLNVDGLRDELNGDREPPTLKDIIDLIPAEKRVIVQAEGGDA